MFSASRSTPHTVYPVFNICSVSLVSLVYLLLSLPVCLSVLSSVMYSGRLSHTPFRTSGLSHSLSMTRISDTREYLARSLAGNTRKTLAALANKSPHPLVTTSFLLGSLQIYYHRVR